MERKNYLLEGLSKEEKSYLKKIIVNVRRKYIRDNYDYLNSKDINWDTVLMLKVILYLMLF